MNISKCALYKCFLIFSLLLFACKEKTELEKALNKYKHDSLKYKAALFLIENMPGHYSYADNRIYEYYSEINCYTGTMTDGVH